MNYEAIKKIILILYTRALIRQLIRMIDNIRKVLRVLNLCKDAEKQFSCSLNKDTEKQRLSDSVDTLCC